MIGAAIVADRLNRPSITAVGRATIEIDLAGHAASHPDPPNRCHLYGHDDVIVIADAADGGG